jgi:hypothetical protein
MAQSRTAAAQSAIRPDRDNDSNPKQGACGKMACPMRRNAAGSCRVG